MSRSGILKVLEHYNLYKVIFVEEFQKKFIETMMDGLPSDASERFKKRFPEGGFDQFEDLEEGRIPIPVPIRVKSGSIESDGLFIHTANKAEKIVWDDIDLIALGIIRERIMDEAPKSEVRLLVRSLFFGESVKGQHKEKPHRETYLLDIYVKGKESPYRIDHTVVNYKSFLGKCGYSSLENFKMLAGEISKPIDNSKIDGNLMIYTTGSREGLTKYKTVYDFELECQNILIKFDKQKNNEDKISDEDSKDNIDIKENEEPVN